MITGRAHLKHPQLSWSLHLKRRISATMTIILTVTIYTNMRISLCTLQGGFSLIIYNKENIFNEEFLSL